MPDKLQLFTLLGDHPATMALKRGEIASDHLTLVFDPVAVPNKAFKAMVREARYDLGELAIVTFLQAREAGKPYVLLPITIMGRGQLHLIFYNAARGLLTPRDLAGKRIGVRSYTTTTGAWIRGMLFALYGVDPNSIDWITFEDPHVAEFVDPPCVRRAPQGTSPEAMLREGALDAAILAGADHPAPFAPLLPDAAAIEADWANRHGGIAINHMLVLRKEIAAARPDVVRALYEMFALAKEIAYPSPPNPDPVRLGVEACRLSLSTMISYAHQQRLIARAPSVDELFAETEAAPR